MTTYSSVLRQREFRAVLLSTVVSDLGDMVAKVALAVTVFARTGSALQAALVYAVTLLPWVVAGPLLGGLADRLPARRVLVACDLARAAVVGALALGALPVWSLLLLVLLSELAAAPFSAARSAVLPEVLPGEAYDVGAGLLAGVVQACQVAGYAVGGVAVALVGPRTALAVDAATFALSAVLLARGLAARPAAGAGQPPALWRDTVDGLRFVAGAPSVRRLLVAAWTGCAVVVLPEALLTPYALSRGLGTGTVGVLLAVGPLGSCVAGVVLTRWVPADVRGRLLVPVLAVAALPLPLVALTPAPVLLGVLLALSGAGGACVLLAQTAVVPQVPPALRGRVFGLAGAGLMLAQGLSVLLGGALAAQAAPGTVIAAGGLAGLLAVAALAREAEPAAVPVAA